MKAASHSIPSVSISIPIDCDCCPDCGELRFVVREAAGVRSICGCNANPEPPAVAVRKPPTPAPLDAEAILVAA